MPASKQDKIDKRLTAAHAKLLPVRERLNALRTDLYTADLKAFTISAHVKPQRWRFRRSPELGRPDTLGPVLNPVAAQRVVKAWRAALQLMARHVARYLAQVQRRADRLKAARQVDIEQLFSPIVSALYEIEHLLAARRRK